MKQFKIVGLCLMSMLVVSMGLAGTAQARWEQCTKGVPNSEPPTKWTTNQCTTASAAGEWEWREVNNTEEVRIKGSLRLTNIGVPIVEKVVVECSGEAIGHVGPGQLGRIDEIKTSAPQCRNIENCEKIEGAEARNTPWQTETYDTEGKVLAKITSTVAGKEPGWKVTCRVLGVTKANECVAKAGEPESVLLANKPTGSELLVLATFQSLRKAKCETGEGSVSGSLSILSANGAGLRVL